MAEKKQLLLLICKTSGSQEDVLPGLKKVLDKSPFTYDHKKVNKPPELRSIIKKSINNYNAIAVYGGDGSITSSIQALAGSQTKLIILPGGTANIIASDLNLPTDVPNILTMYTENRYKIKHYDIATANEQLFVLDMHSGWWTEAIKSTTRETKKRLGPFAYGLSAIKQLPRQEKRSYEFKLKGKTHRFKAHTMLVANQGFQNFLGVPLFPHKHRYGSVQIAVIRSLKPWRLIMWLIGRLTVNRNLGGAIRTFRTPQVTVQKSPVDFLFDDQSVKFNLPLKISAAQSEVLLVVEPDPPTTAVRRYTTWLRLLMVRFRERLRNLGSGLPNYQYSRIAPHLYLGGTYRKSAYKHFKDWGVTGIVNMRSKTALPAPKGFTVLQLKTPDWRAPPLEILEQGVEFIDKQISDGGGAYVHCRQGEGRGPTMAAAYLIYKGLTVEQALNHIRLCRPVSHPNRSQVKRLAEWQDYIVKKIK